MAISDAYAKFRGSSWFLGFICLLITGAAFAHEFLGFDPAWGITNLGLSMEASISVALLMMATDRQDAIQRRQLEYMLHIMEALHAQMVGAVAERTSALASDGVAAKTQENYSAVR